MEKKINILVIPADMYGVGFFRSINPHVNLEKLYPELFHVELNSKINFSDVDYLKQFNIIHFHKTICNFEEMPRLINFLKSIGITPIMDIDDYWLPSKSHPAYYLITKDNVHSKIVNNLKLIDYVTTTTPIFAEEISKYNKNVVVLPNAIDTSEEQFKPSPEESKNGRLRFGILCGSSHLKDIEILNNLTNKLESDGLLDKAQFVLCGFDLRGTTKYIDPISKEVKERNITPHESVWYQYEKILTKDYTYIKPEHKNYLLKFDNTSEADFGDCYRRIWTKPVQKYATGYNAFDVLLVPLEENLFNKCKSQLKVIEAGFMGKAIIAQNFGPYKIDLKNIFLKGGKIDETGNAILIDKDKNHKDWYDSIKKLIKNPELVTLLQKNLNESVKDKYSIEKVSELRKDFYLKIFNK